MIAMSMVGTENMRKKNYRINWDSQPLGKVTDLMLAQKLGVTPQAVYSARKSRGIKPYDP